MIKLILIIGFLSLGVYIFKGYQERQAYINKYTCASWGYMEDCKTHLPQENRLK